MNLSDSYLKKYKKLFWIRPDAYGKMVGGNYPLEKKVPENFDIHALHLSGKKTVSGFPISKKGYCKYLCIDEDVKIEDLSEETLKECFEKSVKIKEAFEKEGLKSYIEYSGRRGYHIWAFFDKGVNAEKLHIIGVYILEKSGISSKEINPKLKTEGIEYGAGIKLPYGIHRVTNTMTSFVNEDGNSIEIEEFLDNVEVNSAEGLKPLYKEMLVTMRKKEAAKAELEVENEEIQPTTDNRKYETSGSYKDYIRMVKDANPISEIAREFLTHDSGNKYFCVFHSDGKNGNLHVHENEDRAMCWWEGCPWYRKNRDVINIIEAVKNVSRKEAIEFLADRKGIKSMPGRDSKPDNQDRSKMVSNMVVLRTNMNDRLRKHLKHTDMDVLTALHVCEVELGRYYADICNSMFYASIKQIQSWSVTGKSTIIVSLNKLHRLGLIKKVPLIEVIEILDIKDVFKIAKTATAPSTYFIIPVYNLALIENASEAIDSEEVKEDKNSVDTYTMLKVIVRRVVKADGRFDVTNIKNKYNVPVSVGKKYLDAIVKELKFKFSDIEDGNSFIVDVE